MTSAGSDSNSDGPLRLRIALLVGSLAPGGVTTATIRLADGIAAQGHDCRVIAVTDAPESIPDPKSVPVERLHERHVRFAWPHVRRLARSGDVDVIVSAQYYLNVVTCLATSGQSSTAVVVVDHENLAHASASGSLRNRVMPLLMRMAYRRADIVCAVSGGAAMALCDDLNLDTVEVLYNPVLRDAAVPRPMQRDAGASPVIVSVGRLVPSKRFDDLLQAFAALRSTRTATLVIIGDGPELGELQHLAMRLGVADDVDFPGYCNDVGERLRSADLFVSSSESEAMPTALIEALGQGLRIVAADCDYGPREVLQDGQLGILVPVGDVRSLATAMEAALEAPRPAAELLERALRPFTTEGAVHRYLDVLSIAQSRRRRRS